MLNRPARVSRCRFLAACAALAGSPALLAGEPARDPAADENKALVAITLDLEMS